METSEDHKLLVAAQGGDPQALEQLLERNQERIYRFGMKMCRHPEDAEDVLQDTLLTMARSIGDFRGDSSISTWLFTIARSYCLKKRRKSKFAPEREHSLERDLARESRALVDQGQRPDEAALDHELRAVLESALGSLEPDQREVLLLRDVEGLTAPEVAKVLEISVAAVKSRLHRARVRLRELVSTKLDLPEEVEKAPGVCPDVLTLYSKYLEADIEANSCAEMERHLAHCPRCQATCDSLRRTLSMCSQMHTAAVPASLQDSVRAALREFLNAPG